MLLWVILFYRLQKVCKVANEISNEPFVYTVLGCLLCKYHFPHSFSYLLNDLVVYFTLVPCYQVCIQKCGINRVSTCSFGTAELTGSSWKYIEAQIPLTGPAVINYRSLVALQSITMHWVASHCSKFQDGVCLVKEHQGRPRTSSAHLFQAVLQRTLLLIHGRNRISWSQVCQCNLHR